MIYNEIFSRNRSDLKNADLNWQTEKNHHINNLITLAKGYMYSSLKLIDGLLSNNKEGDADFVIFPILFNANHAIELYLKAIILALNILNGENKKIEGNHNIVQIFKNLSSKVNLYENKNNRNRFKKMTNNLKEYMDELEIKITGIKDNNKSKDNMNFSRYPIDINYISYFYVDEFDNSVIDLENLKKRLNEIYQNLDKLAEHYKKVFQIMVLESKK